MSSASKNKGSRVEREIAQMFKDAGFPAKRIPLSGAASRYAGKEYESDVQVRWEGELLTVECKARKNGQGFTTLMKWMQTSDILILKQNNKNPLVVLPFKTLLKLMRDQLTIEVTHD